MILGSLARSYRDVAGALVALSVAFGATLAASAQQPVGDTERVSVSSSGRQASGASPAISADGGVVAFDSDSPDLVDDDTNRSRDVFVHDLATSVTARVSVGPGRSQATGDSAAPRVSGDGTRVVFTSWAENLVPGDSNGVSDVFVHDRPGEQTTRVSLSASGQQGDRPSGGASISADGRVIAFESMSVLAPGAGPGLKIYVRDLSAGSTEIASVDSDGFAANWHSFNPSVSADGRYVAFDSDASNLVAGDTNHAADVFVRDRVSDRTTRVSVDGNGHQADGASFRPHISADGRYVAFTSVATNLGPGAGGRREAYVHDRVTGHTRRLSTNAALWGMYARSISGDGRLVGIAGWSVDGASGGTEAFVVDVHSGAIERVSVSSGNQRGLGPSEGPVLSSDGRLVAFESIAPNLVAGDTNMAFDVFVRDRGPLAGSCPDGSHQGGPVSGPLADSGAGGPPADEASCDHVVPAGL